MSWSLSLTTDRPVAIEDAQSAIDTLPDYLRGRAYRNTWGWSTATDILLPEGTCWRLRGAGYSREDARPMAHALADGLRARGYTVTVGLVSE